MQLEDDSKSMKGKVVISKKAIIAYVVITILVIVAVGLMAGLIGKNPPVENAVSTTAPPNPPTTATPPITAQSTTSGNVVPDGPWSSVRLPSTLQPWHYTVSLKPELQPDASGVFWFYGNSSVNFMAMESTSVIIIHSNKLNCTEVQVHADDGTMLIVEKYWLYETNQFLVVELDEELKTGQNYSLSTSFFGELANDLTGLYRSAYTNSEGDQVWIAVTQMQSTDARKAFPCFDEPAMKATFDITLWHQHPYFALSNMPKITTEEIGDWNQTTFQRTLKMSTYLLAFMISDFDYSESFTASDPKVQTRIYARQDQIVSGNVDYARNITPTILEYFEGYFEVPYPLPKSDQAAIPDFALGGMENWGLVMYRETALLFDPQVNSASNKQRVAAVISHELSHQWFGNLISPLWWDELWLNEGFATFIEYLGINQTEPSWNIMNQFVVLDFHTAMAVDSLVSSRPIVAENVSTPSDINALFDDITYEKAGSIVRMINQFTGEEAFRLGLKNYLEEYALGSVDHKQLFQFWEEAIEATEGVSNPPGGFIGAMNTWVLQMGFPTVVVTRDPLGSNRMIITQERFLIDPEADPTQPTNPLQYKWYIPFWYVRENEVSKSLLWIEPDVEHQISVAAEEYIVGNYEVFGYYRVNYDQENWQRIIEQLNSNFNKIEVKTRAQIIDDAFNLARIGKVPYSTALNLTKFLRNDFDYVPWESALDVMSYFNLVLGRSKVYGLYSDYLLYLVDPLYGSLTWIDGGDHLEQFQRVNAIQVACSYGNRNCSSEAFNRFHLWQQNTSHNRITPNLRSTVYCQGVYEGGVDEWDFVWMMYQAEADSQEKSKLQYALTCSRVPWINRRFLEYSLNDTYVRKQDASSIFQNLCYNEYARDITWDYLRQNWDFVYEIYGTGFFSFSGIIQSCSSHFSTEFELNELQDFVNTNADKLGSGLRAAEQALERTKANIQWRELYENDVLDWLSTTLDALP